MEASRRRLIHMLQTAAHRLRVHLDREGVAFAGVSSAQFAALARVKAQPGISQRELARMMLQRESATTTMVSRLTEAGLLRRTMRGGRGRTWSLEITPEGAKALDLAGVHVAAMNSSITEALGGEDQVAVLASLLEKLIQMPLPD